MLMVLGLVIYAWGKRVFGYRAGLISLLFFTPVFLGDGRLVTLDLGAALFMTAPFYSFYLMIEEFTTGRFIATSFLCAAALLSRFNMLILVLMLPLLALIKPFFTQPSREHRVRGSFRGLRRCIAVLLLALVILVTFYGIHTSRLTPQEQETSIRTNLRKDSSFTETLLEINKVLPPLAHYLQGIAHDYEEHVRYAQYSRGSYWDGKFDKQWRCYYYPFIFLVTSLAALMVYFAVSVMLFYPSFLSYSNELIIDKNEAYRWLIDSNLDWGQDLRRLADYVEEEGVTELEIDYFGGGDPQYYMPEAQSWSPEMGGRPHGWFALSYVRRQRGFSDPETGGPPPLPSSYGNWIQQYEPVARIGDSILLYDLT